MAFMEVAGISRSNPYYVVQQGKVTLFRIQKPYFALKIVSMANMGDCERFELLKEIGGVKIYEERRKESSKIMKATNSVRITIEDMVHSFIKIIFECKNE